MAHASSRGDERADQHPLLPRRHHRPRGRDHLPGDHLPRHRRSLDPARQGPGPVRPAAWIDRSRADRRRPARLQPDPPAGGQRAALGLPADACRDDAPASRRCAMAGISLRPGQAPTGRRALRPAPVATPARAVLRLQRAAGNRAVRELLRATLFDGLDAATRAQIQSATAPIVGDKIELDDFGKSTTQLPQNTTVAFGAAVPTDATFRKGLQSTAADRCRRSSPSPDVGAARTNFRREHHRQVRLRLLPAEWRQRGLCNSPTSGSARRAPTSC